VGVITFFVPGLPQPGGSKRAFINPKTGRPIITEDNPKSKDWRASVAQAAAAAIKAPLSGPLEVIFEFYLPRPANHTGKKGLRKTAPMYPVTRPDVLKLSRSTEDALKGIAFVDDSQIVMETLTKQYGQKIGCGITINELDNFDPRPTVNTLFEDF
jgi:Holliday junction resolvase RusA-like endonuclease